MPTRLVRSFLQVFMIFPWSSPLAHAQYACKLSKSIRISMRRIRHGWLITSSLSLLLQQSPQFPWTSHCAQADMYRAASASAWVLNGPRARSFRKRMILLTVLESLMSMMGEATMLLAESESVYLHGVFATFCHDHRPRFSCSALCLKKVNG